MSAPETALRSALIQALKNDATLQTTAMGIAPRVLNRVPPATPYPFLVVSCATRSWDTTSDRGAKIDVELKLLGEYAGDKEGEAIFWATQLMLRDWAPRALDDHWLVNLERSFQDVRADEDGKLYFGLQRWVATTEEASVVYTPAPAPASPSLTVEEEERQTRIAAETIAALRLVRRNADGRVSLADASAFATAAMTIGVSEGAATLGNPLNIRTAGVMVDAAWAWNADDPLYLGASGQITNVEPVSGVWLRIGTALSATSIFIRIETPVML